MMVVRLISRFRIRNLFEVGHYRIVVPLVRRAMVLAVASRDAQKVARLLRRVTRTRAGHAAGRIRAAGSSSDGESVTDILLLAKSGLTADFDAAFADDPNVRIWLLEREWVKAIALDFLGTDVSDYRYSGLGATHELQRLAYRHFLVEVLRHYLPTVGASTMVTGNYVYWAEREIGPALRELGGRLIVLHKEGLLGALPLITQAYRRAIEAGVGIFEGDAIGVYNDGTGRLLVDIGVIPADRVHVVGTPRIDEGHAHRRAGRPGALARRVTFFTFPTWRGLTFPFDPSPEPLPVELAQGWSRLLEDTVEAVISLAERRPDLDVVAKVKAGGEDDTATARLRAAVAVSRRDGAGNLRLVVGGEGGELVLTSRAIIAFNSTVIPEAIAAGTAVVVPAYGEASLVTARSGMLELGTAVTTAATPEDLIDAVTHLVDTNSSAEACGTDLDAEALDVLERLVGNADGRAGERLRRLIKGGDA